MALKFYNTASRREEEFIPLEQGKVGMYVCGVTVYDLCHIGHARSAIVFDVLVRYLRARGYRVTYVRNFTDVDDKIIQKANEIGKNTSEVAEQYIGAFYEDMDRLGVLKADIEPRATEHIAHMIEMIQALINKGYAYVTDGDVYFAVEKFDAYGQLSGRKLEDMQAGCRIAVEQKKRHPMDFALWKGAKPGEPKWDSPWGPGRPGWHIECSVMSNYYLGPSFDIHGGGRDLLFPHHENERAQSIAANGGEFARYWIHNGFVTVESEKMSKSLGNFVTIRDALKRYHPEVIRLFLLSKHYRSPIDFSHDAVSAMNSGLVRVYRTLARLQEVLGPKCAASTISSPFLASEDLGSSLESFTHLLDDDLNTAGAVGLMFDKVRQINKALDGLGAGDSEAKFHLEKERDDLFCMAAVLGILQRKPEQFFEEIPQKKATVDHEEIERLIAQRAEARARKDWALADKVRDQLRARGIILEDGPKGTTWRLDV